MYPFTGKGLVMQSNGSLQKTVVISDGKSVPYTIKKSPRARRVSLKFTALEGLVVVVPHSYDISFIPAIVDRKKEWIAHVIEQFRERTDSFASASDFPDMIDLRAEMRAVGVQYVPNSRPFSVRDLGNSLVLSGRYDTERVQNYLRQWVRVQARQFLVPLLIGLAQERGIRVAEVNIRFQKGRWGSCSFRGVINLNARLMFLPNDMARYVCMHELAHCTHHNHSSEFWGHLEQLMPGAGTLDRSLRDAWKYVPKWAYM